LAEVINKLTQPQVQCYQDTSCYLTRVVTNITTISQVMSE